MTNKTSTGYRSTGNRSTGNGSTGNWSTGDWSTGNGSTGNWSISNYSTGHFSTEDYSGYGAFNRPCSKEDWDNAVKPSFLFFNLTQWVPSEGMVEEEKTLHPCSEVTVKALDYKEAFSDAYRKASQEEKELLLKLPNFDPLVFLEISGIDVRVDQVKEDKRASLIKKAEELLAEAKAL